MQAQRAEKLFFLNGGVLDDVVGSAADALVPAQGLHVGGGLDLLEGLLGALGTLGEGLVDLLLSGQEALALGYLQHALKKYLLFFSP